MLAQRVAFQMSRMAASSSRRAFTSAAVARKDFVQDLYLRELKSYKPKEVSANAHVGQVKDFHAPTSPQAPSVPSGQDLAKELEAYEREEVATAPTGASAAESDEPAQTAGQTADEYISFVEQEARRQPEAAHH